MIAIKRNCSDKDRKYVCDGTYEFQTLFLDVPKHLVCYIVHNLICSGNTSKCGEA